MIFVLYTKHYLKYKYKTYSIIVYIIITPHSNLNQYLYHCAQHTGCVHAEQLGYCKHRPIQFKIIFKLKCDYLNGWCVYTFFYDNNCNHVMFKFWVAEYNPELPQIWNIGCKIPASIQIKKPHREFNYQIFF